MMNTHEWFKANEVTEVVYWTPNQYGVYKKTNKCEVTDDIKVGLDKIQKISIDWVSSESKMVASIYLRQGETQ